MLRQASSYEKIIFDMIKEYNNRFYYQGIKKFSEHEQFSVEINKEKREMTGRALVKLQSGESVDYEIKYNRITNLKEGYTLIIPGILTC